jgi:putative membrane protein
MNIQIKYGVAGFCMGIAELIPGISGSTIAVIFKIYPNLISILSNLRLKNFSVRISEISKTFQLSLSIPLMISMIIAILLCSKGIDWLLKDHHGWINIIGLSTTEYFYQKEYFSIFLGSLMIFLSIYVANFFKDVLKNLSLLVFLLTGVILGFFLNTLNINSSELNTFYIFLAGILAFSFFLIPGISGSAILLILGVWKPIIQALAEFNFVLLIPFGLGCLISLLVLPSLINSLYSKYEQKLTFLFSGLIFYSGYFLCFYGFAT